VLLTMKERSKTLQLFRVMAHQNEILFYKESGKVFVINIHPWSQGQWSMTICSKNQLIYSNNASDPWNDPFLKSLADKIIRLMAHYKINDYCQLLLTEDVDSNGKWRYQNYSQLTNSNPKFP
jgi:homospermidine synthase